LRIDRDSLQRVDTTVAEMQNVVFCVVDRAWRSILAAQVFRIIWLPLVASTTHCDLLCREVAIENDNSTSASEAATESVAAKSLDRAIYFVSTRVLGSLNKNVATRSARSDFPFTWLVKLPQHCVGFEFSHQINRVKGNDQAAPTVSFLDSSQTS
jgi:hypothetical protein